MDKTPEEQYREELKKRLTEKKAPEETVYYSQTGFRKNAEQKERPIPVQPTRPRRRIGPVIIIPFLLIFMMTGRFWQVALPLLLGVILFYWIRRAR